MQLYKTATIILAASMFFALPVLSGCAPGVGGYNYTAAETQQTYTVYYATVTNVQTVNISSNQEGGATAAGAVIGAVAGGVIGSTIGHGPGRDLATVGGALLGGAAGAGAGHALSQQTGQQITVKYDNGVEQVIVQGGNPWFQAGQRVKVLVDASNNTRVVPEN